ncbi:hypothetical protein CHU92_00400, partial [Flavobacterium cyanobacteriorum]
MKKILPLLALLTGVTGIAQCPPPTDLTYSMVNGQDALLAWTESGEAIQWEIAIVPDFFIGAPLPSFVDFTTASNPLVISNAPITSGCIVYFVRSSCSPTEQSPWVGVGTSGCPPGILS